MPAATDRLLRLLGQVPEIRRFTLVGGTAIALQAHHRDSEDLDFAYPGLVLPQDVIRDIRHALAIRGVVLKQVENLVAAQEFENAGLDLLEAQQDYLADGVKLTFFAPHEEERRILSEDTPVEIEGVRVASLETLFRLKALLLTHRVTRRDLFDLYFFTHDQGRPVSLIFEVIHGYAPHCSDELVKHRLLTQPFPINDPGFESLTDRGLDVETIQAWFEKEISRMEIEQAEAIARRIESESGGSNEAD